ncbi:MAG: VWA domain-containing protein [Kiritimatiellae bacterium]|nr:VWA domain-containing protein [Kiritimatiellia bacterium]
MSFAYPWAALLAVPFAVAAWRMFRRGDRRAVGFSALSRIPRVSAGWRSRAAAASAWIFAAGAALLIVAAMRPRVPLARETRSVDAIAIAMVVDVSGSMAALDLTPPGEKYSDSTTRLAVVKKLFAEFVEKRPDDLIALVTFGGYASARSPLTGDHAALLNVLKGVEIPSRSYDENGMAIAADEQMTAVGDGLACALSRLKDSKPASKIVILLSDGVSNTGAVEPEEAAEAASRLGVKVYAIGVGTMAKQTPIFARNAFTGRRVLAYADMTFDEAQLKSIAAKTGGRYFSVNDRDSLSAALEEIDELEKTKIEADSWNRWNEKFQYPLSAGAALAVFAVFLSVAAARRIV